MPNNADLMKDLGSLAVASRLRRLSDQLVADVSEIYERSNFAINPRYFPFLSALKQADTSGITAMGVTELAKALGLSHPAVCQVLKPLESEGWISVKESDSDARCRKLSLTPRAKKILTDVEPVWQKIQLAIDDLLSATGINFMEALNAVEDELQRKSLTARVFETKEKPTAAVTISTWDPKYQASFVDLNLEWIETYFSVEQEDRELFSDPESIVKAGGMIFFARLGGSVVGTCALIKHSKAHLELGKMAVSTHTQGSGIGRALLMYVIEYAKKQGAKRISLESATVLKSALRLYRSVGFKEIPLPDKGSKYSRVDIAMELLL